MSVEASSPLFTTKQPNRSPAKYIVEKYNKRNESKQQHPKQSMRAGVTSINCMTAYMEWKERETHIERAIEREQENEGRGNRAFKRFDRD